MSWVHSGLGLYPLHGLPLGLSGIVERGEAGERWVIILHCN